MGMVQQSTTCQQQISSRFTRRSHTTLKLPVTAVGFTGCRKGLNELPNNHCSDPGLHYRESLIQETSFPYVNHTLNYKQLFKSLCYSGKVYIVAEKLLMPGIKVMALERVRGRVSDIFSDFENTSTEDCITAPVDGSSEFISLFDNMYENLPGSDVALKASICRVIAVLRVEEKFFKQLMPVMQKYGNLVLGGLNYLRLHG